MRKFLDHYGYQPRQDLREVAEALYDEVGAMGMALIEAKIRRVRKRI